MNRFFLALVILCFLATNSRGGEVAVSAAASLTNAITEMARDFEIKYPGIRVNLNFASSGVCFRQIQLGAPVDLFLSADPKWITRAGEEKLIDNSTVAEFARNTLVLAVPASNPAGLKKLGDLAKKTGLRIAIGNPRTVPAGQYAQEALQTGGIWEGIADQLIRAEDVRQVLDYLKRDEVDAGFVYRTDATLAPDRVTVITEMGLPHPVTYPAAIILNSCHRREAMLFLEFLQSQEGCRILSSWDFGCTASP